MTTVHGGLDAAELRSVGLVPKQVLDFSSNINPLGPSARVRQSVSHANLSDYPDRHSLALREALSERLDVDMESLVVGNGSTELIHLLARCCLRPGEKSLIFEPTFGEYRAAATIAGAQVVAVWADAANKFQWAVQAAIRKIEQLRPRLVFLCNPNNPTGVQLSRTAVWAIHKAVRKHGMLLLDDAYMSVADHPWETTSLLESGGLAILRSMTKDHALAGLRLGYLIADPSLVSAMRRIQPAWSVNAIAQTAGLAATKDQAHLDRARAVIGESKDYLCSELNGMGIPVTESAANYLLVKVGDAASVRRALLRRRIAVRDCSSFGLPEYIRVAVRRLDECALLVKALGEEVSNDR